MIETWRDVLIFCVLIHVPFFALAAFCLWLGA